MLLVGEPITFEDQRKDDSKGLGSQYPVTELKHAKVSKDYP